MTRGRTIWIAILLGVVALLSAVIWGIGQYGGATGAIVEAARPPLVREPQPAARTPTSPRTAREATPATAPAPSAPDAPVQPASDPSARSPNIFSSLNDGDTPVEPRKAPDSPAPPAPSAGPQPGPQPGPQSDPRAQPASAPAAAASELAAQFKTRRITYNRPPARLALNKPIDVSLVINATADVDAGKDALKGFPGTVVERDVELSNTVSAQLTGVGFDITSQTVDRQKLSGRTVNRWQWRVTPTEEGTRTLILAIFGYASGSADAEPLDQYRDDIVVEVQQFDAVVSWAKGVQPVFAVMAALAAMGSAIFAFLRFREEKKQTGVLSARHDSPDGKSE